MVGVIQERDLGIQFGQKESLQDNKGSFRLALIFSCFEYKMYKDKAERMPEFTRDIKITFEEIDTHKGRQIIITNNKNEQAMNGVRKKFNGDIESILFDKGPQKVITGEFNIKVDGGPLVKEAEVRAFIYIEGQDKPAASKKLTIKPDGFRRDRFE